MAPDVNLCATDEHWLVHRSEAGDVRHRLRAPHGVRVGRSADAGLVLTHAAVSRDHALLEWVPDARGGGRWRITDHGSASGTRVNGVALRPYQPLGLEPGDRLRIGPLEFEYLLRAPAEPKTAIARLDSGRGEHASRVASTERIDAVTPAALDAAHLDAVVAAGAAIHAAVDERGIADAALDAIARASGFTDVAFVRTDSAGNGFEVFASRGPGAARLRLSTSVLARARLGPVVVRDSGDVGSAHQTLARMSLSRVVCVPVELGDRFYGLIYLADGGAFRTSIEPVAALVRSVASVAALAFANLERLRMTTRLEAEQRAMFDGTMQALIATIDAKDPYTRGHSARVADFAHLIALRAGLSAADAERARLCGLVHDIGKIGVGEDVLRKPGRLTEEEFRQIAAHPVIGHDILRGIPQMADVLPGVLHHHEKWAGGGYPHGIAGDAIPVLGRVIAVADALDAMTTSRTYRGARPMAAALEEIARCAGTHFDPLFAEAAIAADRRELQGIVGLHVFPVPSVACGGDAGRSGSPGAADAA